MYSSNLIKYPRGVSSIFTSYGREMWKLSPIPRPTFLYLPEPSIKSDTRGTAGSTLEGRSVTRAQNNDGTETGNELGVEELSREKKRKKWTCWQKMMATVVIPKEES